MLYYRKATYSVWAQHTKSNIYKIESVQWHAARFVVSGRQLNRLMMLTWYYKVLSQLTYVPYKVSLLDTVTRGHNSRYHNTILEISFFPGTVSTAQNYIFLWCFCTENDSILQWIV